MASSDIEMSLSQNFLFADNIRNEYSLPKVEIGKIFFVTKCARIQNSFERKGRKCVNDRAAAAVEIGQDRQPLPAFISKIVADKRIFENEAIKGHYVLSEFAVVFLL